MFHGARIATPNSLGAVAVWIQIHESYSQLHRSDRCVESDGNLGSELRRSGTKQESIIGATQWNQSGIYYFTTSQSRKFSRAIPMQSARSFLKMSRACICE